jgi:hypothetical protein
MGSEYVCLSSCIPLCSGKLKKLGNRACPETWCKCHEATARLQSDTRFACANVFDLQRMSLCYGHTPPEIECSRPPFSLILSISLLSMCVCPTPGSLLAPYVKLKVAGTLTQVQAHTLLCRFMGIAEQMGRVLQRTSISVNIKERLDFSCALFGPDGSLVANAPHLPVHLGAMSEAVRFQVGPLAHMGPIWSICHFLHQGQGVCLVHSLQEKGP